MILALVAMFQTIGVPTPPPPPPPPPRRRHESLGIGALGCTAWLDGQARGDGVVLDAWLAGYLTALNEYGPDERGRIATADKFPVARAQMQHYCAQWPAETIDWAAGQVEEDLLARLGTARSGTPR